ncbi:MAG: ATP-dependent DNA helicase RecG [Candidatus Paceibacterota bacterium]
MPITLSTKVSEYFRITPIQKTALKRLGIETLEDLLYHFPVRYGDTAIAKSIDSLQAGDTAVIFGKIGGLKASKGFKTKIAMADGYIEDETGRIHCVWFNQPYLAKMIQDNSLVRIEGKVSQRRSKEPDKPGEIYFSNPKVEAVNTVPIGVGDSLFGDGNEAHTLYPVYPESRGISSSWIYHSIQKIFKNNILETLEDPIPESILTKYHLPSIKTAIIWIHTPLSRDDALSARKRFSFEEIFVIQIGKKQARKKYEQHPSFLVETPHANVQEFVRRFPFQATNAQTRAIETITSDMRKDQAMSRLLEGDVGSGKTAVAAATAYAVMVSRPVKNIPEPIKIEKSSTKKKVVPTQIDRSQNQPLLKPSENVVRSSNLQVAYMCPTEILASQHFESFIQYFSYMPIQIGLITGSGCRKFPSKVNPKGWTDISRTQLLQWVANGEIAVLIGTHALIQKAVEFKNLAYVIIDEQHRFGTAQRAKLVKKSTAPHLLSMTATPIPRTLALTMYGDLDLTLIDESPAGRKPVITELVLPEKRNEVYEKIRQELQASRQMFVICPRINEPDPDKEAAIIAKSVKEEAIRLKRSVFPEYEIDVLHSKMKPDDKDAVMKDFKDGKIDILCATSVVEVGVNVPNATVMIIEGAERFGLAQLHQLRGRVMRSSFQAYCYAFTETTSAKSIDRLKALQSAKNAFELAELDLSQRGAGQLSGTQQWGVSDIAMEALQNLKMVEAARAEASLLIEDDVSLSKYPILKKRVDVHMITSHFE